MATKPRKRRKTHPQAQALANRATAEQTEKPTFRSPGTVMVFFKEPVGVPWYRWSRKTDSVLVYSDAQAEVVPTSVTTLVRVVQATAAGQIVRLFDWSDIETVTIIPALSDIPKSDGRPEATSAEKAVEAIQKGLGGGIKLEKEGD